MQIYYLRLPSADLAVARVAERVARDGHNIPEDTIRRRFARSSELFESTYKNLADDLFVFEWTESGYGIA